MVKSELGQRLLSRGALSTMNSGLSSHRFRTLLKKDSAVRI